MIQTISRRVECAVVLMCALFVQRLDMTSTLSSSRSKTECLTRFDFMNPAPDAELQSVGAFYHGWVTEAVTNLVFSVE